MLLTWGYRNIHHLGCICAKHASPESTWEKTNTSRVGNKATGLGSSKELEGWDGVRACVVMSDSLRPHGLQPARLLGPWNVPGKNTGVGCHFFLQGIFPIPVQGLNLHLLNPLHWQADSFATVPPGKHNQSVNSVTQSSPTVCDPMDCSLPGSSIHGISQARVLEGVAMSFSMRSPCVCVCVSCSVASDSL